MTTGQHPQQNEPNEFGFAGDATGPEPRPDQDRNTFGEDIAVPADDLTAPLTRTLEEATNSSDD
ncbi:hypothetical protein AB0G04_02105 [Actinoplanes sp. NPDC023801]|uniref:hypothetical protein n=1 Tax=Actinoplanes sp. NPDC023801 TaxID=3154595 RepID=UPI0033E41F01